MLLMVASGFVFIRERLPLGATLLAVLGAFLLVASPRYVAISGLLAAPFAALSLVHLGRYGAAPAGPRSRLATLAGPVLGLLCVITLVQCDHQPLLRPHRQRLGFWRRRGRGGLPLGGR